ncbi:MAG: hypothetical protein WD512_17595 [Candidatus Paceibacterota bacterium]
MDIDDKELFEILNFHRQMLELETPSTQDLPYHKLRLWMSKNLYQVIREEEYLNTDCDQDVEDMLKIFTWIIKYLAEISILIKGDFDDQVEKKDGIKKFIKRLLYLFKTDIYLCYRTHSKVDLTELIIEVCEKQESSNELQ